MDVLPITNVILIEIKKGIIMIPFLVPILSTLASNGLGILAGAIQAKGREVIEEKLGIKIPSSASDLTPELLEKLKEKEMEHEEFLISMQIKKAEVEIKQDEVDNANTDSARKMNASIQESANAARIAKTAPYILDFVIVTATLILVAAMMFKAIPPENKELAYMALGSLLTMCGTILNFHRGTSASSHSKDNTIHMLSKGE